MKKKLLSVSALVLCAVAVAVCLLSKSGVTAETIAKVSPGNKVLGAFMIVALYGLKSLSIVFPVTVITFACGLMFSPEEYLEYGWTEMDFWPIELLYVLIGMAAASVLVYLVCWIFSKKQVGWMVAVTVFFAIDTVFLFLWYEIGWDMIVDYLFHAWVMYSLIRGLVGRFRANKLAKHPAE